MWRYTVRNTGTSRLMKLGDYPDLGLADPRRKVERLRIEVLDGADPLGSQRTNREIAKTGGHTLGDLIDTYLAEYAPVELAPRSIKEYRRYLTDDRIKHLRAVPAKEVTAFQIGQWMNRYGQKKTAARRAHSALSAVFTWALPTRRLEVESNPVRMIPRPRQERAFDKRWLTEDEIRQVLKESSYLKRDLEIHTWAPDALFIILATGQRPGEVVEMRWEHLTLNDKDGKWSMPADARKRVRGQKVSPPHDVPLSASVVERLGWHHGSGYVFPRVSLTDLSNGHKTTTDLNKWIRNQLMPRLGDMKRFTPHDLRRTCRTHLGKLDVPQHIAKKILGHVDPSVDGVYDRGEYWPQRTEALNRWGACLAEWSKSDVRR